MNDALLRAFMEAADSLVSDRAKNAQKRTVEASLIYNYLQKEIAELQASEAKKKKGGDEDDNESE